MFEQPLYEFEPAPAQPQESDLFNNYELKGWISSPGLFKVIGISAVANIVAILVVAQTSLLTMKGCDSPLVGSVCQVLDTVYVGSLLFGTDREYVDAAYDKIDLGDSEITYIDVSKETPPLTYPVGYFQLANPEEMAMINEISSFNPSYPFGQEIPGIPGGVQFPESSNGGSSLFDTPPNIPKHNPSVVNEGDLPPSIGNSNGGGLPSWSNKYKPKKGKRPPLAPADPVDASGFPTDPDPNAVAEKHTPSPSPTPPAVDLTGPVADVELNKRPFIDLANTINGLLDKKMVNLETPFLINAIGKLDKNGKLDRKSFSYTKEASPDPRMIEVIKEAIEAMNESNFLQYLSMVNAKDLSFEIFQDDQKVVAVVQSEFDNPDRANTMSGLLKLFIDQKKKAKEAPDASQNDKDDLVLLQNAKVEPRGKKLVVSFMLPKADMQRMIQRMLAEQKAQPKPAETTGGVTKPTDPAQK